ncbi:protein tramtrack: beta isoform-like protein [Leptotrombidium deliense]|uniref:Protein tramtrack: beta isoform-like protein n=1 Tax=Leptotrombidium deliense TaxID=299467 RepID=A0A443SQ54_9ACAR|nr:protein tramtrack: beta isoform-like protein [Leptotrombidium deliense]
MFDEESLFDCTIVCEGKLIKGHKLLLAAASQYFKSAFTSFNNPCQNTAVIIREVPYLDLKAIIDFIYRGEVFVDEKQITSLEKSVEALKVSCLNSQTLHSQLPKNNAHMTNNSHQYYQRPQQLPQSRQQPASLYQSYYSSMYQSTGGSQVKLLPSQYLQQPRLLYKPHEPFVQLKELLRRETPVSVSLVSHSNCDTRTAGHTSDGEERASLSADEYEVDIPRNHDFKDAKDEDSKLSESDNKSDIDGCSSIDCQEEQVIDMSVNRGLNHSFRNNDKHRQYSSKDKNHSHTSLNNERSEMGDSVVTITSQSLPMSLTIPSSVSSATARAIAASTTLAVASGLLNSSNNSAEEPDNSPGLQIVESESQSSQSIPLKRGRGRPPRHSRDEKEEIKTYKVRPILPSSSSSAASPGIIISSEPSPSKRGRPSLEALMIKGRKTAVGSSVIDTNGKNMCPYCPQVYYSTQAMNDHINNVHTRNAHKYICEMCSKEFSWKISLTKHLRNSHKEQKSDTDEKGILIL